MEQFNAFRTVTLHFKLILKCAEPNYQGSLSLTHPADLYLSTLHARAPNKYMSRLDGIR